MHIFCASMPSTGTCMLAQRPTMAERSGALHSLICREGDFRLAHVQASPAPLQVPSALPSMTAIGSQHKSGHRQSTAQDHAQALAQPVRVHRGGAVTCRGSLPMPCMASSLAEVTSCSPSSAPSCRACASPAFSHMHMQQGWLSLAMHPR